MFAYKAKLEAMESDEFAKLKSSLCSKLTERLFKVEALTKEDVLALYPEFLEPSQQHCLILEYGKSKGNEFSPASDNARVYSTEEFRSIQEFLPKQWVDYEDMSLSYRVSSNHALPASHKHKRNGKRKSVRFCPILL